MELNRRDNREKKGNGLVKGQYTRPMDMDNRDEIDCGKVRVSRAGEINGRNTGTTVIEQL